jgi:hypothetical protein
MSTCPGVSGSRTSADMPDVRSHPVVPERHCLTDDDSKVVRLVGLVVGVGVDGVRRMACELPTG